MTATEARACLMCGDSDVHLDQDGLCQWCADEVDLRDDILARRKLAELEAE